MPICLKLQGSINKPSQEVLTAVAGIVEVIKAFDTKFNLKIQSRLAPLQLKLGETAPLKPMQTTQLAEMTDSFLLPSFLRSSNNFNFFTLPRGAFHVSSEDRNILVVPKGFGKLAFINRQ